MKSARIVNEIIVDLVTGDPYEFYHADIASLFENVPDRVDHYWRRISPGTFEPPPISPAPTQAQLDAEAARAAERAAAEQAAADVAAAAQAAAIAAKEQLALDTISKKSYAEIETYIRGTVTNLATAVDMMVKMGKLIKALVDRG